MHAVLSAIAFLNWERNLASDLGMTHGQMKELVTRRVIKPGMSLEDARKELERK